MFIKSIGLCFGTSKQGIKDIVVSFIPQFIGVLSGLIASVLIARGLGPSALGHYALIMSYVGIASLVSDMGIGQTAIRYASLAVAQNDIEWQKSVLRWALRTRIFLALLAALGLGIFAPYITENIWNKKELTLNIYIALTVGIIAPLTIIPTLYFQSIRNFSKNSILISAQRLIGLVGVVILSVFNCWQISFVLIASVFSSIVGAIISVFAMPNGMFFPEKKQKVKKWTNFFECPRAELRNTKVDESPTRFAALQLTLSIVITLSSQTDIWLMGIFLESDQIGIYSAAMRFNLPLGVLIATINTVLWPRVSACVTNIEKLSLLTKVFKLCAGLFFFAIIYSWLTPQMMGVFFGEKYSEGVLLAQLLCIQKSISLFYCSISLIGYSLGLLKKYVFISLLCYFVLVVFNVVFLPFLGFYAPAIALIASETLQLILGGSLLLAEYKKLRKN